MTTTRLLVAASALCLMLGCEENSVPPEGTDGGGQDAGMDAGAGAGTDGGTDGGLDLHGFDGRGCFGVIGKWSIDAGLQAGYDAGGFSPCIPLPALGYDFTISQELGVFYAPLAVGFAGDAGCGLTVDWSFTTTNPSETYTHAIHLELDATDAGLLEGGGTYTLSGGSNCQVPLDAVGTPVP